MTTLSLLPLYVSAGFVFGLPIACNMAPDVKRPLPAAASAQEVTATNLDFDIADTAEDPAYATAGEALTAGTAAVVVGQTAPFAVMKTIDGETIDLANVYGKKPVYIKFWATWCVPCRQQMPAFEKAFESFGDKVQFIALNIGLSDDEASVRALGKKYDLKMPIVMDDGHFASLFHLSVTPQHVLIGRDSRFAYVGHAQGANLAAALEKVNDANAGSLAVRVPAQATTPVRPLRIGDKVPSVFATTTAGTTIELGGSRPGVIRVVHFFSSWCEWYLEKTRPGTSKACARTREQIQQIAGRDADVEWIGIAGGPWATGQDLEDYKEQHSISIPLALDTSGALFRMFGIRDMPTVIVIDASGIVANVFTAGDGNFAAAIDALHAKGTTVTK
jgi:peroxiredoxin